MAGRPVVEMLWEPHDPGEVLHRRFGLQDADTAARWVGTQVNRHWGLPVETCERIVLSHTNALAWVAASGARWLAKWSIDDQRFARLARIAELLAWLGREGLPVSAPVPAADGRLQLETDGVSMGLQRVIAGELLDVGDPGQVHATGATLARVHLALARYPRDGDLADSDAENEPLPHRLTRWIEVAGPQVPDAARDAVRRLIAQAPDAVVPVQLVHGDIRAANVLCSAGEVAAVLDFEELRRDHCVDELARSSVLLGTRFHDWGPVSSGVRARFRAGYESVRPLSDVEAYWHDVLVLRHALAFVPVDGADPTGWGAAADVVLAEVTARH